MIFMSAFQAMAAIDGDSRKVLDVTDIETLNDDIKKYDGKTVRVKGEVEDKIDTRSVVIESGGVIDDEIVVIGGPNLKGQQIADLVEDSEVVVTGTVVSKPMAEIRKQYGWNVDEKMAGEFRNVKSYLIADEISTVQK